MEETKMSLRFLSSGGGKARAESVSKILSHILFPAFMATAFFTIAFTPVEVLGCRFRGLAALLIAFICGLGVLRAAITGARRHADGHADVFWWVLSAIIFVIPVVGMILLA